MSEKFTPLLAACALTLVGAATSPALAKARPITVTAPPANVVVRQVSFRDLNLASHADENILVSRVRVATREVCNDALPAPLVTVTPFETCRTEAWDDARPQIKRAVRRARQIATNGFSAIAPVAITLSVR